MFMRRESGIAVLVAVVVLMTGSPAMAQSSDLLASATRSVALMTQDAETQEAEQVQSVIRRRRSGGLAGTGAVLAGVGIVLALRPPNCSISGPRTSSDSRYPGTFSATQEGRKCGVKFAVSAPRTWEEVVIPGSGARFTTEPPHPAPITKKTWNYVGWATAATGGALLGLGLSRVEVPVRLDVAPGRFRVARSLGW